MTNLTVLFDLAQLLGLLCAVFAMLIVVREAAERRVPRLWQIAAGATLGAAAIVSMSAPVTVAPGIIVDPRAAILVWAAPVGGWPAALVAAATALGYRATIGGPGWLAGSFLILAAVALGVVLRRHLARRKATLGARHIGLLTAALVLPTLASFLLIRPLPAGIDALARTGPAIALVTAVGTLVLGALIGIDEKRRALLLRAERSEAEARRLAEAQAAFVADVGHEIRTPISGIVGFATILERTGLDAYQAHCVASIRIASGRLTRLIDDILDHAKSEAGTLAVARLPLEVTPTLEGAVALVEGAAAEKGLAIHVVVAPHAPRWVVGDADRLTQIALNLLTNAIKFTQAGRITLAVEPWVRPGGSLRGIRIDVTDTGVGIAAEDLEAVFERFRRVEAGGATPAGSGLGLGIARSLARAMGGDLRLDSTPGAGTRATVELALPPADAPDRAADPAAASDATAPASAPNRRVLVAEDDAMNREVLSALLGNAGCIVETVADGRAALARALDGGWDAIVMDLRLPGLDGIEAIRRIRRGGEATPIIVLSGDATDATRRRAAQAGATRMLVKPAPPADVLAAITAGGRPPPGPPDAAEATPPSGTERAAGSASSSASVPGSIPDRATDAAVEAVADLARVLGAERAVQLMAETRRHVAAALASLDPDRPAPDLAARAHGLIGPAGTVFGSDGVEALRALEQAAAGGDAAAVKQAIGRLRALERELAPPDPADASPGAGSDTVTRAPSHTRAGSGAA